MFISLEGIEGSGKSTQINYIVEYLNHKGRECVITREPGGTKIGEKIRSILLDAGNNVMDPLAELLLYMADRAQHIKEVINPHLMEGKTVICDRYFDATVVYQGYARGLDIDFIIHLHKIILDDLKPDLTILLDLPPETGLSRAWNAIQSGDRNIAETRFEEEKISFHRKVRNGYLALSKTDPSRFRVIDASGNELKVRDDILEVLPI